VRDEAHRGNARYSRKELLDGERASPTARRRLRQAGDKEHQPVCSPENTGHPAGTPLRHKASSLGWTMATRALFGCSVHTLATPLTGGEGVRRGVGAFHASDETAVDAATLRWLQGEKPAATVGGTGAVPDGRKAGAYGQRPSVPRGARRKRGPRSCRSGSTVGKTGAAATEGVTAWRRGGRSRRRGTPCTWRSPAGRANRYGGESRGRRRLADRSTTQRSVASKALHHPAPRFDHLSRIICRQDGSEAALRGVLTNTGARTPGLDGMPKEDWSAEEAQRTRLQEIAQERRERSVRPTPVRRVHRPQRPGQ